MNKIELLGFLLQDLRDDREPDEEDLSLALCRETSKIFELIIQHGYLTRDMFDPTGISEPKLVGSEDPYRVYKTTNYPISYVVFADSFADWLLGKDKRERLEILDLIYLIKEYSGLRIKILCRADGSLVVVRNRKRAQLSVKERVFIAA